MHRVTGFYWVRESPSSFWVVAHYNSRRESWGFAGNPDTDRQDSDLAEIDEHQIVHRELHKKVP